MAKDSTSEEKPKKKVAKEVITSKRRYFSPEHGVSVEADSIEEAQTELDKLKRKQAEEEGDATK